MRKWIGIKSKHILNNIYCKSKIVQSKKKYTLKVDNCREEDDIYECHTCQMWIFEFCFVGHALIW